MRARLGGAGVRQFRNEMCCSSSSWEVQKSGTPSRVGGRVASRDVKLRYPGSCASFSVPCSEDLLEILMKRQGLGNLRGALEFRRTKSSPSRDE